MRVNRLLPLTLALAAVTGLAALQAGPASAAAPSEPLGTVTVGAGPTTPVVSGKYVFVANSASGTVSVIDRITSTLVKTIPVGTGPTTPLASADRLYVPITAEATVSVIDTTSLEVATKIPVGEFPTTPVMAAGGTVLVVPNTGSNSVSIVDASAGVVIAVVPVGVRPGTPVAGTGDQYASYLDRVYVANEGSGTVSIVDARLGQLISTVTVGASPGGPIVTPILSGSNNVYVPNRDSATTTVFTQADGTVLGQIATQSGPVRPTINTDGSLLFIPNSQSRSISVFDTASQSVVRTLMVGKDPGPGATSMDGRTIYFPNRGGATLAVVDAVRGTLAATIRVGFHPTTPAIAGTKLYVSGSRGTVTTVDISARYWPTVPRTVRVKPLNGSALVAWQPPRSVGPAPILRYRVLASTGQTCLTAKLSCTVRGLAPGSRVSFEVRAVTRLAAGNGGPSRTVLIR